MNTEGLKMRTTLSDSSEYKNKTEKEFDSMLKVKGTVRIRFAALMKLWKRIKPNKK